MQPSLAREAPLVSALSSILTSKDTTSNESSERWAVACAIALGSVSFVGVQTRVAVALRDEARVREPDAMASRELVELGAVDALVSMLRHHGQSPKVTSLAISALGNIAASAWAEAKSLICSAGTVEMSLTLLLRYGADHVETSVQVCRALGNLCFGLNAAGSVESRRRVMAFRSDLYDDFTKDTSSPGLGPADGGHAMRAILDVLRANPDRPDVVRWSCHALGNIVYGQAPNTAQDVAVRLGVDEALVCAATPHLQSHPKTAGFACEALANLAFRHVDARDRCIATGVPGFALVTLETHAAANQRTAEQACFCLASLELPGKHELQARIAAAAREAVGAWGHTSPMVRRWGGRLLTSSP